MKNLLRTLTVVTMGTATMVQAESDIFMSFDFENGEIERGFDDWHYADKGTNPCNVYNGESQSKLCGPNNTKLLMYYNYYNNDHMGWTRYGFIDGSSEIAVTGSSLKLQLNGGAYKLPNGEVEFRGIETRSKSDAPVDWREELENSISEQPSFLGNPSLYIKGNDSTSKFSNLKDKNRFSVWVLLPQKNFELERQSREFRREVSHTISWYPFIDRSTGGHYYHRSANVPMGGWTKIQFDAHPSHHNGGVYSDYNAFQTGGTEYAGNSTAYFENITSMGLVFKSTDSRPRFNEYYIDNITTDFVEFENEETINNLGVGYDPRTHRFDISFEDKYRCLECDSTYQVRYSFSPINNANFNNAHLPQNIINFDRQKNNSEGLIFKPNKGYYLLWAAFDIKEQHKASLTNHKKIYFAVKDLSTRELITQQPVDFDMVEVPNAGEVRKMDLIKTIEYEIIPVAIPMSLEVPEQRNLTVGQYDSLTLGASGGEGPYTFFSEDLPLGLVISNDGVIEGTPYVEGSATASVLVKDSNGQEFVGKLALNIVAPPPEYIGKCKILVDFKDSEASSEFYDSRFNTIITDRYTRFLDEGTTIALGSNKNYDFTRIEGQGFYLPEGAIVRLVWKNVGESSFAFSPQISFSNAERPADSDHEGWIRGSELFLSPGETGVSSVQINSNITSTFLNTNVNYEHNSVVMLDRIELIESTNQTTDLCENKFKDLPAMSSLKLVVEYKSTVIDSHLPLAGLSEIIKDKYTSITELGSTITIGRNATYDYQGVKGAGYSLKDGDKVILTWFNELDYDYTFSPKLSFTYEGRFIDSPNEWLHLETITIPPKTTGALEYEVKGNEAEHFYLVNVNTNAELNKGIYLKKIEFSESLLQ